MNQEHQNIIETAPVQKWIDEGADMQECYDRLTGMGLPDEMASDLLGLYF